MRKGFAVLTVLTLFLVFAIPVKNLPRLLAGQIHPKDLRSISGVGTGIPSFVIPFLKQYSPYAFIKTKKTPTTKAGAKIDTNHGGLHLLGFNLY